MINMFFHKGKDDITQSEVGFLVHKDIEKNIKQFHGISDHVISLTLKLNKRYDMKIIKSTHHILEIPRRLEHLNDDLRTALDL